MRGDDTFPNTKENLESVVGMVDWLKFVKCSYVVS